LQEHAKCAARIIRALLGKGLITSEGQLHAMHKRLMKPAFNRRPIASEFYPHFTVYC